jgi:hypothetical protein
MCFFLTSFLADSSTDQTNSRKMGGGHRNAERKILAENWAKLEKKEIFF